MVQLKLSDVSAKLTKEVIQRVFRRKTASDDEVIRVTVSPAAPPGEGLIGAVYRVTVEGTRHKTSFIAKGLVKDQLLRKSLICAIDFSKREAFFFSKILPALVDVQTSLGAKENLQNNVPIYYGSYVDGANDYVLLEDLAETGCKYLADKPSEYERDTTLKALAHLHATSIALKMTKPKLFDQICQELPELYYTHQNRDWYANYIQNAIDIDLKVLAEYEDPETSIYYKKFRELIANNAYEQLIALSGHGDELAVFNHGDAWIPNFLCSEERVVAIDFQVLRSSSIALDLSYFLTLCSNLVRTKEDHVKAIKIYYNFLKHYLRDMGFDEENVFSWNTLNDELQKYGKFGILAAITSIPLLASEKCNVLENFEDKFAGYDKIPLEELWKLTYIKSDEQKMLLVNAVRVAVDAALI